MFSLQKKNMKLEHLFKLKILRNIEGREREEFGKNYFPIPGHYRETYHYLLTLPAPL